MSDAGKIFSESLARVFTDYDDTHKISSGRTLAWSETLWKSVNELGLPLLMIDDAKGGAGGSTGDLFDVLAIAGRHGVPLPMTETVVGAWLASIHGLTLPAGPVTLGIGSDMANLTAKRSANSLIVSGTLSKIPWGRTSECVITLVDEQLVVVNNTGHAVKEHNNLADEPSDTIELVDCEISEPSFAQAQMSTDSILRIAALGRAAQMCGAMHAVLELTMQYVSDREQFGRPLKKFQAIQHYLAKMYCEVVAASTATRGALELPDAWEAEFECAAAIVRTREAASAIAALSHQCHGAIGFTAEYQLGRLTKRLWAWRDEYGDESEWRDALGRLVLSDAETSLWQRLTDRSG